MKRLYFNFNLKVKQGVIAFVVVFIALYYRRPDAFTRPQFWAEDGIIFFGQSVSIGLKSLITTFAGYQHLVPRLLANLFAALHIGFQFIPLCYNYSSYIITSLVVIQLLRFASCLKVKNKWIYATFFLFLPGAGDLFMNITNLNWILALFTVQYLFVRPVAKNTFNYALDLIALALSGLSGPISTVMCPLALAILVSERRELNLKKAMPMLIVLMCGVVQFYCIKFIEPSFTRSSSMAPEPFHLYKLVTNNMMELFFLHDGRLSFIPLQVLEVFSFLLFLFIVAYFIWRYIKVENSRKYILLSAGLLMLAVFIAAFWPNESRILGLSCTRYYFITFISFGWIVLLSKNGGINIIQWSLYLYLFFAHSRFSVLKLPDRHWGKQVEEFKEGKRQEFDLDPDGDHVRVNKPY